MTDRQEHFPLCFKRAFQPWSYSASHRTLVLRSWSAGDPDDMVDLEFVDVVGMKTRTAYKELLISVAGDPTEIEQFVDVPERHRDKYMNLLLSDGAHEGFVVCRSFRVHMGNESRQA